MDIVDAEAGAVSHDHLYTQHDSTHVRLASSGSFSQLGFKREPYITNA
jgi:hypothetical protein